MPWRNHFDSNEEYNKWYRDYRKKHAKKMREYKRKYNKKWRKENGYEIENRSKRKYPEKRNSRNKLNRAIKTGKIKRHACRVCGKYKAQGHHDDYSKPYDVKWFCPLHHRQYEDRKKIKNGRG